MKGKGKGRDWNKEKRLTCERGKRIREEWRVWRKKRWRRENRKRRRRRKEGQ